ncbi:imelysin family protein [Nannocystis pusilla]|uniref:imelysin family protein n=1 Tax=Nannocystis pusilla TaxID=889268 RepID=UPI003B78D863
MGQDLSADGPGARPWTDYVDGADGTAANQDRRREYLTLTSELLLDDLARVADAWSEGQANYRADFVAQDPKEAIAKILLGMASLSGAELAGERMTVAYDTREQEDEHSCFSDNTHKDLLANIQGIEDVYVGRIDGQAGPSLSSLVARIDADVDAVATAKLQAAVAAVKAIPAPFDAAIQAKDGSPERAAVKAAIDSLKEATDALVAVADALEIELNLE